MDRCALFVDAGYLLADGAMAVHGTRHREAVSWDFGGLLQLLGNLARERTGQTLLRCYWYESTVEGRRAAEHETLADLPGLKLRLGRVRPGRREGVDTEIHRDLMTLARNQAVSDAIVVSGDEDLVQIISDAQDLGVRVTVLHVAVDGNWTISRALRQECDDLIEISSGHLRPYVNMIAVEAMNGAGPLTNGNSGVNGGMNGMTGMSSMNGMTGLNGMNGMTGLNGNGQVNGHNTGANGTVSPLRTAPLTSPPAESPLTASPLSASGSGGYSQTGPQTSGVPAALAQSQSQGQTGAQRSLATGGIPPVPSPTGGFQSVTGNNPLSGYGNSAQSSLATGASPLPGQVNGPLPGGRQTGQQPELGGLRLPQQEPSPADMYATGPLHQQALPGPNTGANPYPSGGGQLAPIPQQQQSNTPSLSDAVKAAHQEGQDFGESVARDAPALWLEAVLARKPRMPSDLEARLLQGSSLPIDYLLHDEVRHALRRGFWDALERSRR